MIFFIWWITSLRASSGTCTGAGVMWRKSMLTPMNVSLIPTANWFKSKRGWCYEKKNVINKQINDKIFSGWIHDKGTWLCQYWHVIKIWKRTPKIFKLHLIYSARLYLLVYQYTCTCRFEFKNGAYWIQRFSGTRLGPDRNGRSYSVAWLLKSTKKYRGRQAFFCR